MVKEITENMLEKYETVNFSLTFPQVFEDLYSDDANFEMASSNTVQPLKIFYRHNIVTHKIGAVFVNGCKFSFRGFAKEFLKWGKTAEDLLKEDLEFEDLTVWKDLSKS